MYVYIFQLFAFKLNAINNAIKIENCMRYV